ncbi:hypothetical protein KC19_11G006900 [Ceratodon purpureus]|uniref:Uncharacterized protein n=1 Tax=Ceratodon purpureus TaxID=3225 RepID=A0A8T0GAV9_CERPU|nr:hypothetical protein KC19_11G006900 [Ceratodon purpureus]
MTHLLTQLLRHSFTDTNHDRHALRRMISSRRRTPSVPSRRARFRWIPCKLSQPPICRYRYSGARGVSTQALALPSSRISQLNSSLPHREELQARRKTTQPQVARNRICNDYK